MKIGTPAHLNKKVKGEYSKTEIKDDEALAVRAMARTAVHNVTSTDTIKGLQTTSLCDTQLKEVATQIAEARNILELARYANVHTQKPLTDSELKFIYFYPNIAAKIMTVNPYYSPKGALKERMERLENVAGSKIV